MAMEIVGKLIKVLPEVTGQSAKGTWSKQEFILETADQYPKKVAITAWGDKVGDLKQFALGDTLKVSFNLESREYNERWYTEARAWRMEVVEGDDIRPDAAPAGGGYGRMTGPSNGGGRAPQPTGNRGPAPAFGATSFDDGTNDLPF